MAWELTPASRKNHRSTWGKRPGRVGNLWRLLKPGGNAMELDLSPEVEGTEFLIALLNTTLPEQPNPFPPVKAVVPIRCTLYSKVGQIERLGRGKGNYFSVPLHKPFTHQLFS